MDDMLLPPLYIAQRSAEQCGDAAKNGDAINPTTLGYAHSLTYIFAEA